ncbi:MAG: TolC family protein [Planctomycetes bacterium]|nr:TolC family protein [Planctomycetota bacterium]
MIAATARHPRLALAQSALQSAEARIARAGAARWPQAAVGGYLERGDDTDDAGVALSLTLPLWDGGRGEAAIARAALARARAEFEVERAAIARDLEVAWLGYRAADERAGRLVGRIAPAAQEALRLAMRAYEAGETSLLDVVDVRRTAQEARAAAADAAHEVHSAAIHVQHTAGSFLVSDPTSGDQP